MAKLLRDFVRVENDFTIIPNEILRNKEMKSSVKNILLTMLSLPPEWDFSIAGISACVSEGRDKVQKSLIELEKIGYITRKRERKPNGTLGAMIYTIHQFPVSEDKNTYKNNFSNQDTEKPEQVKPTQENPILDSKAQLRTDNILNTDNGLSIDDELNTDKEKGENINKVNAEVQTSISGKKQMHTPKTAKQRYLEMKADEFEMLHNILSICNSGYDEQIGNEIFKSLEYYFERYTQKTGLIHPILKKETLKGIIDKMANYTDTEYCHFENIAKQDGAFIKIIDAFFDGDFGSVTGQRTNWHLPHFMSNGVLDRLTQRLWEKGEVY